MPGLDRSASSKALRSSSMELERPLLCRRWSWKPSSMWATHICLNGLRIESRATPPAVPKPIVNYLGQDWIDSLTEKGCRSRRGGFRRPWLGGGLVMLVSRWNRRRLSVLFLATPLLLFSASPSLMSLFRGERRRLLWRRVMGRRGRVMRGSRGHRLVEVLHRTGAVTTVLHGSGLKKKEIKITE